MIKGGYPMVDKERPIDIWTPSVSGFGGGIGVFTGEMARGFRVLGRPVRLVSLLDESGNWEGFEVHGGEPSAKASRRALRFTGQVFLLCIKCRPREIICTHVNLGPLALAISYLFGIPFTLVAHGVDVHPRLSKPRRWALRHAHRLLAVSEWTRQRLIAHADIDAGRIAILPNTFDETRFYPGQASMALRRKLAIPSGVRIILMVARLDPAEAYKGYDRVVQALPVITRYCGPVRFVLVGKGADAARVLRLAEQTGVGDAVQLAGYVADEELPDYYRLADVFAMPSTGEGFGIVFLEAMGCGAPVLAGNRDGSVNALDGGRLGGLVDPASVEEIAAGIIRLLQHEGPGLWFNRGELSAAVGKKYGRAAFRDKLREIFG
jgi:phosphatidyl-myo-inositol dimannoside synthase